MYFGRFLRRIIIFKKCILGDIVGDGVYDIPRIYLSKYGKVLDKHIKTMSLKYENIFVEKYVIMPNHIHLIINITDASINGLSQAPNPTKANAIIPKFISLLKRYCNRENGIILTQTLKNGVRIVFMLNSKKGLGISKSFKFLFNVISNF